jgi:MFS transporter, MHS family, citrate/tricarballylate:H+ symporter
MPDDASADERGGLGRRSILAATIGNALEFYDFITYGFFAIQIGHAFFPAQSAYASLMLSLGLFGAGFVTRPLGGIVIGIYGDRVGRRPAMMLSFTLMGLAILVLALIPSYATIGIAAPIIAVCARLVQGFSLGGEVGPTTAYLLEAAPLRQRGLAVSWQGASQGIAGILAGVVGLALSAVLTPAALDGYGWRVAFLLGAVSLPVGLWLRRGLPETLHIPEPTAEPSTVRRTGLELAQDSRRILILSLLVLAAGTIGSYVSSYMTTFAQHTLHMSPTVAFAGSLAGSVAIVVGGLLGGSLSDRLGRRPVMVLPALAHLILMVPIFYWIVEARSALALIIGALSTGFLAAFGASAFYAAATESLPKRIRGGAFAIVYALSNALFGGTTQLIVTWLIHLSGSPMAPVWYMFAASAIGLVARWLIIESAPARTVAATTP